MKIILILAVFVLLIAVAGRAQNGKEKPQIGSDPCSGRKYLYQFADKDCNNHFVCVENPFNAVNDHSVPSDYKLVRWLPGTDVKYSVGNLSDKCVDNAKLKQCIDHAFCNWTTLCPTGITATGYPENLLNTSIIPIGMRSDNPVSSNRHEFGEDDPSVQATIAVTVSQGKCSGKLIAYSDGNHRSFIDVNGTNTYKAAHTNVYPCPSADPACKASPVDICTAMTHEVGHLLGLNHTKGNQLTGPPPDTYIDDCGSSSDDDIMYFSIGKQSSNCKGREPDINDWTVDDKCMYRKLYCYGYHDVASEAKRGKILTLGCNSSSVASGSLVPSFDPKLTAYPNPSGGTVTIGYLANHAEIITASIFDMLGNLLFSSNFRDLAGPCAHSIDLSSVANGYYVVRITGVDMRGSSMILLRHD